MIRQLTIRHARFGCGTTGTSPAFTYPKYLVDSHCKPLYVQKYRNYTRYSLKRRTRTVLQVNDLINVITVQSKTTSVHARRKQLSSNTGSSENCDFPLLRLSL